MTPSSKVLEDVGIDKKWCLDVYIMNSLDKEWIFAEIFDRFRSIQSFRNSTELKLSSELISRSDIN